MADQLDVLEVLLPQRDQASVFIADLNGESVFVQPCPANGAACGSRRDHGPIFGVHLCIGICERLAQLGVSESGTHRGQVGTAEPAVSRGHMTSGTVGPKDSGASFRIALGLMRTTSDFERANVRDVFPDLDAAEREGRHRGSRHSFRDGPEERLVGISVYPGTRGKIRSGTRAGAIGSVAPGAL